MALPVVALFGAIMGVRAGLAEMLAEPAFVLQLIAGLAIAALAYVGLRLVHPQDAAFLVAGAFGRWLLFWRVVADRA